MVPASLPFLDLKAVNDRHAGAYASALARVLASGQVLLGEETRAFEAEFARYCGVAHAVGVGNGLDALHLVLRAWGVGAGDEVIVPAHTFIATWLAVSHCGAAPVPVEPAAGGFNIDVQAVAQAITPRTRAIIAVHLYGEPANMGALRALADRHGLKLLEDAAQAHGAVWQGRRVGGLGDAAAFSFYPGKNLGALGDGGAVTTDDPVLAERVRQLRNYGSAVKYEHREAGFNSRLDELQAAFLRERLKVLDDDNLHRAAVASLYHQMLQAVPGLQLPTLPAGAASAWHLYVIRHARRDELARRLALEGVATLVHYPIAPHRQQAYGHTPLAHLQLPRAEAAAAQVLSLPMGPTLALADARRVALAVRQACGALAPHPTPA